MIITNGLGRAANGKFARGFQIEWEPDDYPPDSNYWRFDAIQAKAELEQLIGVQSYNLWAEIVWPEDSTETRTFKDMAKDLRSALALGKDALMADLECVCTRDPEDCCAACAAQARITARVEDLL